MATQKILASNQRHNMPSPHFKNVQTAAHIQNIQIRDVDLPARDQSTLYHAAQQHLNQNRQSPSPVSQPPSDLQQTVESPQV